MIFYLILVGILVFKIKSKKDGGLYLRIGFYLFLLSAVLDLLKIMNWPEFIIRVGFIFLLVGLFFTIKEKSQIFPN